MGGHSNIKRIAVQNEVQEDKRIVVGIGVQHKNAKNAPAIVVHGQFVAFANVIPLEVVFGNAFATAFVTVNANPSVNLAASGVQECFGKMDSCFAKMDSCSDGACSVVDYECFVVYSDPYSDFAVLGVVHSVHSVPAGSYSAVVVPADSTNFAVIQLKFAVIQLFAVSHLSAQKMH